MTLKKILSWFAAITLGVLTIAPPIDYRVPLYFNQYPWVFAMAVAGFFGFLLCSQRLHILIKAFTVLLYFDCFFSQAPASSFTACALIILTIYFFLLLKTLDYDPIFKAIEAAFWFQVFIVFVQFLGKDTLMEWGSTVKLSDLGQLVRVDDTSLTQHVFFGTVFQPMRLASLMCIEAPFLLVKDKRYFIPLLILSVCSETLGFSLALIGGLVFYVLTVFKEHRKNLLIALFIFAGFVCFHSRSHIRVEIVEGRLPIWAVILKSWIMDTTGKMGKPDIFGIAQTGPIDWTKIVFGHGLDTFVDLFRYYKHDPNPFPQAHNDWLQIPWEIGVFLTGIVYAFSVWIVRRLWKNGETVLVTGLIIISINMFFAFPWRMTQTIWIMVAFLAYCIRKIEEGETDDARLYAD